MAEKKFEPVKCPPRCVYAMLMCGTSEKQGCYHCGYILITGHMRGCNPGYGCTRYLRGKRLPQASLKGKPKGKPFTWDAEEGKRMWQRGCSDREIAEKLGVSRGLVCDTRNRRWRKGK